ncbi:PAS domain S-box protein [Aquabacterium sp.]|uniref:PAS domain S-box protein n=1 Tax=Aquabacterium sp. TaxID=1872578 RepID=UPI0035B40576
MDSLSQPFDESTRLGTLRALRILDTPPEDAFDVLCRLACRLLQAPAAALTLVDDEREWHKAVLGFAPGAVARGASFAAHLVDTRPCTVTEQVAASSFADSARAMLGREIAGDPAWLAGAVLSAEGQALGALVVARTDCCFAADDLQTLRELGQAANALLEARLKVQRGRLQEARLRTASQAASDWLWETDAEGRFTWVSDNILLHSGLKPADIVGKRALDLYQPDPEAEDTHAWARYLKARSERKPFSGLITKYPSQDTDVILSINGLPVFDSAGNFRGYRGASRNVTRRSRVELDLHERESQLRLSEARLTAVLSAIPDLWFVLDRRGCFQECSVPEHPLLSQTFGELRGQPLQTGLPDDLAQQMLQAQRRAQQNGQPLRIEFDSVVQGDRPQQFEARLSPMPGEQTLILVRDLTELNALKRDVELMEQVLEAEVSLAIMVSDAQATDWPLIYVNPAFERLTGYTRGEVLGRSSDLLVASDQPEQAGMHELRAACVAGRSCTTTVESLRRDGTRFLNQWHLCPVRDVQGRVTHFISVLHDVTERTREAEKLRVSEELYRSVAAAISDGLLVVTLDGRTAAINPAACRILGVRHEAMIGHRAPYPFDLLEPDLTPLSYRSFPVRRVLKEGKVVVDQVTALRRPDGEIRWLSLSCHPLRMAPDEPVFSAVATFRDITETRQAAQALRQSEERWKFALEGAGDGVWDWDLLAERVFYSRRWKAMLGLGDDEVGDSLHEWLDRIHPDDKSWVVRECNRYLAGAISSYQAEYRMRHKDGHDVWVLDRGKIVDTGPNGQARRVVGTHSDVTRQREAENALRDKRAAELASQAKSEFLSRMSHEIRTPLNAVLGFAQLLKLAQNDNEAERLAHIDHILRAGQHLLGLINDVLDLQRVEEGRLHLDLRPIALDGVVNHCMSLLTPQAEAAHVNLVNLVPAGITVQADEQRLRQVLLNIGSNGIKYNRDGGQARWSIEYPEAGRVRLIIEDDGPGMSPEQLTKLFQPFERLGKETSSIEGSGLGLIIARSLTEEMQGHLDVRSQIGLGSRVEIELPCVNEQPSGLAATEPDNAPGSATHDPMVSAGSAHESPPPSGPRRAMRLMYVEDNRINAMLFEQALKLHPGFELRIAEDGQHALEIAEHWTPDVLVLDAHLPGMSGFEALLALRTLPGLADAPAFMCSADAMPEDVQRAKDAGFMGYWTKPIEVQLVLADLETLRPSLPLDGD